MPRIAHYCHNSLAWTGRGTAAQWTLGGGALPSIVLVVQFWALAMNLHMCELWAPQFASVQEEADLLCTDANSGGVDQRNSEMRETLEESINFCPSSLAITILCRLVLIRSAASLKPSICTGAT